MNEEKIKKEVKKTINSTKEFTKKTIIPKVNETTKKIKDMISEERKKCSNCGATLLIKDSFCSHCGKKIEIKNNKEEKKSSNTEKKLENVEKNETKKVEPKKNDGNDSVKKKTILKKIDKKVILIIAVILFIGIGLLIVFTSTRDSYKEETYQGNNTVNLEKTTPEYQVGIEVNCTENLIFSKYNVKIFVDDINLGTLNHGATEKYEERLKRGMHKVKFVNDEDSEVIGETEINILKNSNFKILIYCTSSKINVEENKEVIIISEDTSEYIGKPSEEIKNKFIDKGFTNIKTKQVSTTEQSNIEGSVKSVLINGNNINKDDAFSTSDEVIIYCWKLEELKETITSEQPSTSPSQDTQITGNLTIDNCPELFNILSNKAEIDQTYTDFASKYKGETIEFDGSVDYVVQHGNYKTRVDMLLSTGNYDENHQIGPSFKFNDVGASDLGLGSLDNIYSSLPIGSNVHIIASVEKFDSNTGLFYLKPVSVTKR